ncbi:MAG: hypothetical protein EZS28_048722, partial [Streblomastix strix]
SPSLPQTPNGSTNAQQLLSDRDGKDIKDKGKAGDKGKKTEDVLKQLQDENSDLKNKVAFIEKRSRERMMRLHNTDIITIQEESRWREQEKLNMQMKLNKKKILIKKKILLFKGRRKPQKKL